MKEEHDFEVLPIAAAKDMIITSLRTHQIIIVIGETGSGKTTQLPQYILTSGLLKRMKMCAVTQPRRVAAQAVAMRVAYERECRLGEEVGYAVRFDDKTSSSTRIKFMTDGILVRECLHDPLLSAYDVVMLDEAHDRSLHTDILFGLIKKTCLQRPGLKVLITSATLDADKFSLYFNKCPVIHVPGRIFPVDIYHSKLRQVMTISGPASSGYIDSAVEVVMKIHKNKVLSASKGEEDTIPTTRQEDGHILVFMTGRDDIEQACAAIKTAAMEDSSLFRPQDYSTKTVAAHQDTKDDKADTYSDKVYMVVIPLYGALSAEEQHRVFENLSDKYMTSDGKIVRLRKCIISTNIAETSITVPHVKYVVDSGYVKQKAYDPVQRIESLVTVPISKVSAAQRAGRSGRTGPGQCYRLYSLECASAMYTALITYYMLWFFDVDELN